MQELRKRIHGGTILGVLAAIYIAFYLVQTVRHNYLLQKQISGLQGQVTDLQNDRDTLKYRIQYYQTDAYREKEARAKLGLQLPGEGVVIIPHKDAPAATESKPKKAVATKSHLQLWIDFLRGIND